MGEPIVSPDGNLMWDGFQWVPVPPDNIPSISEPQSRDSHWKVIWNTTLNWILPTVILFVVAIQLYDLLIETGKFSDDYSTEISYILAGVVYLFYVVWRYEKIIGLTDLYSSFKLTFSLTIIIPIIIVVIADFGSIPIAIVADYLFPTEPYPLVSDEASLSDPIYLILVFISLAIVAPITEELAFRGLVLDYLRKYYGNWPAIILSAVMFGLIHFIPPAIAGATYGGIIYGWLRIKTEKLWPSMICHSVWNSFVFFVTYILIW